MVNLERDEAMLVRLDENALHEMKWRAREVFAPARHGHTLEALARGLGVNTYKGLLTYAQSFGGIMWDGDDTKSCVTSCRCR